LQHVDSTFSQTVPQGVEMI